MALEADLYTWLNAQAPLTALVGDRIYPGLLPQNAILPALVYSWADKDHDCLGNGGGSDKNLAHGQLRFEIHAALVTELGVPADAYAAAHAVAEVLRLALFDTKQEVLSAASLITVTELHSRDAGYDDFTGTYRVEVTATLDFTESPS